jgi:hypothetical protein
MAPLQKLAGQYGVTIVVVHHDRKMTATMCSTPSAATLGLTGAVDTMLVLKRQSGTVTLHVRGRDIEDAEKALQFSKDTFGWTIIGEAADVRRSDERGRVLAVLRDSPKPVTAKDIQLRAEMTSRNATDLLLHKMLNDGEVERSGRGLYTIPGKIGQIGQKERSDAGKVGKKEGASRCRLGATGGRPAPPAGRRRADCRRGAGTVRGGPAWRWTRSRQRCRQR